MNPLAEYRQSLIDAGFSADDAERIIRWRAMNREQKPGRIVAQAAGDGEGELLVYESIGFDPWDGGGLTPKGLVDQLAALGAVSRLTVRINSPGGSVFDAITIMSILRRQGTPLSVEVEGLAASSASFLAQVADPGELRISEAGMMFVHRAWNIVAGNAQDMTEMAAVLEKLDSQIAGIYAGRSGRRSDTWLKAMADETWYSGAEAVDAKLADKVVKMKKAAASIDIEGIGAYRNAPVEWVEGVRAERAKAEADERAKTGQEAEAVRVRLRLLELEETSA